MELAQNSTTEDTQLRILTDLVNRSRSGAFFYPFVWILIAVDTKIYDINTLVFYLATIYFLGTSWIRFRHLSSFYKQPPERLSHWAKQLKWFVIPQSLGWGLMFSYSMFQDSPDFELFMAFSLAGICAGGTNTFAPDKNLSRIFVGTFLIPPMIFALIAPDRWVLAVMIFLFLVFVMGMSRNQSREYWQALQNESELVQLSNTDPLTQLCNRRSFDEKLNELCHLSSRAHEMLSLAVIDIDHFKSINDTYGHVVGDECLKAISKTLGKSLTRTTDTCSRYGGEEFCVILPGTDSDGAIKVCERLREDIENTEIKVKKQTLSLKVSIGCVTRRIEKFQQNLPEQLFIQADRALYDAKEQGRNCCVHYAYDEKEDSFKKIL